MNILWFVPSYYERNGKRCTRYLSVRQRCIDVVEYLEGHGSPHHFNLIQLNENVVLNESLIDSADMVIFSTINRDWTPLYNVFLKKSIPIISDIEYNIFADRNMLSCYQSLFRVMHAGVTANEGIGENYRRTLKHPPVVIHTALPERNHRPQAPRLRHRNRLGLVWYGPTQQLNELEGTVAELSLLPFKVRLEIVCPIDENAVTWQLKMSAFYPHMVFNINSWSTEQLAISLRAADFAIFPETSANFFDTFENRIPIALKAGIPVIAAPTDENRHLAPYIYLTNRPSQILGILFNTPDIEIFNRIEAGQLFVNKQHNLAHVANRWRQMLENLNIHHRKFATRE